MRDPPQARSTVPAMPTGSTPRRYEHRSDRATSYTRSTQRWRSSPPTSPRHLPHTVTLQQCTAVAACTCRTPQHHLLRARWSFPTAGAAFIASSRAKCVSSKYHSPRPTRTPGASSTRHAPLLARAAATAAPHRPRHGCHPLSSSSLSSARSQHLSGTGSTTRSIAGARNKCNARFPSPAPPSSPLRAPPPSSTPTPPSAPNFGLPRIANATCTTPGVSLCGRPIAP
ncbi:hypothetical protein B0H14DRAFT_904326 [Mycena olivaceomarginata]|nr:hypothetical protein B0H14DRAFT_904326 [Mycena olivaceomarginata]